MKIGIIGTGNMGRTMGGLWALAGHEVFFGARRAEVAENAATMAQRAGAQTIHHGTNDQAAAFGDVLVYSPRGIAPSAVLTDPSVLDGKVLVDINNWDIPPGFAYDPVVRSLAETLQEQAPRAYVVKAFNTLARQVFELPADQLRNRKVTVLIAGDHAAATETVATLARDLGFAPLQSGGLRNARLLETAGDLIRYFIIGAGLGPFATLNVDVLPATTAFRFADN